MILVLSFRIAIFLFALIFSGCISNTSIRRDGSSVKHYFGYVRVAKPPTEGQVGEFKVSDIETIGISLNKGFGIGYFHDYNEYIPLDCRLVVRVANRQQLEDVIETLTPIIKEGLCVTVSQH